MAYIAKIRLYIDNDLPSGGQIQLDREQTHYLATVMRIKVGAMIALFNGRDGEWLAKATEVSRKSVSLDIVEQTRQQQAEPDVWLLFAPIKKARLDFMAQKATELGVGALYPVMTERTMADRVKVERLAANAREAAEQCERLNVPNVIEPAPLTAVLADWPSDRKLLFCDEMRGDNSALEVLNALVSDDNQNMPPWAILIGPEGGFSDSEREKIQAMPQAVSVALGPRILRADTAAIAALTLWQSTLGDWD